MIYNTPILNHFTEKDNTLLRKKLPLRGGREAGMPAFGVIAEYNPFHRGVVAVMSGNWVQRGSAALAEKHARAEMALSGGADLVLELPVSWAAASAERFARGGVGLLKASGVVQALAFGSETGDLAPLRRAAEGLDSPAFSGALKAALASGAPFAAARQRALADILGGDSAVLARPNDLLAVEYLRADRHLNAGLAPLAVRRVGPDHDGGEEQEGCASASAIRRAVLGGETEDAARWMTPGSWAVLAQEMKSGRAPADLARAERAVLAQLRRWGPADFAALPDCGEGLENRLYAAARQGTSLEEVYALAKTKRYAHARIRRLVLWAWLGMSRADFPAELPYLRVLGLNRRGRQLLREMKEKAALPIVVKPAAVKDLGPAARRAFELEARATDLWQLCLPGLGESAGDQEWRRGPVVIDA